MAGLANIFLNIKSNDNVKREQAIDELVAKYNNNEIDIIKTATMETKLYSCRCSNCKNDIVGALRNYCACCGAKFISEPKNKGTETCKEA